MPSRATALLGDLGSEVSSRLFFMRSSYDILTVVPESRRITYGGDFFHLMLWNRILKVLWLEMLQFSV